MKCNFFVIALIVIGSIALQAQQKKPSIIAEGGDAEERASARVLYWDRAKNGAAGQFAIDYGRPAWKKEYEDKAKFDGMTNGKVWRLGKDFWTVLDTSVPLKIAGKDIPVGAWYLGLHRSIDGRIWSLAFIDPAKVRKAHLDAFDINKAPVEFKIPMISSEASNVTEKLTTLLSYKKESIKDVTLKILWGNIQVSASVQVAL
ncbi:MAG TPA: DUF2911 domain-containing protein [Acidobacteriota bacterium]|jgi:hypothetical protein|nr:DUF2911 domain-containing protein [Acidobacteriota bacterium]